MAFFTSAYFCSVQADPYKYFFSGDYSDRFKSVHYPILRLFMLAQNTDLGEHKTLTKQQNDRKTRFFCASKGLIIMFVAVNETMRGIEFMKRTVSNSCIGMKWFFEVRGLQILGKVFKGARDYKFYAAGG